MKQARYRVVGTVQGVGFRWWTRSQADRLGLRGWVRNLADGSVEVVASGSDEAMLELRTLLESGPPGARVASIEETTAEQPPGEEFTILT